MRKARDLLRIVVCLVALLLAVPHGLAATADAPDSAEQAVQRWGKAVQNQRMRGSARELAEALGRRAEAYQALGHRQRALVDLEEAAALVAQADDIRLRAAIVGALGQAHFLTGS